MQHFITRRHFGKNGFLTGLLCVGILGAAGAAHADSSTSSKQPQEVPYDADLFNKDKSVWFVNAEFLYWLVNESALDYAIKMHQPAWSPTATTGPIGHMQNASFDWSPGFRVNFGYFRAPHYWDAFVQYTYLKADGSNRAHAPKEADEFLNGTWIQPEINDPANAAPLKHANSHIDLTYQVLDFLFSRRFQTNEHLRINLFGGLTSAIIFQKWRISYKDTDDFHASLYNRWRFEGIGLRVGTKVDWYMGYDLYLTGGASAGILSGWYKNTSIERSTFTEATAGNSRPIVNMRLHDNRLTWTAQFLAGISWQKRFTDFRTEIFAGYELTNWTNLVEMRRAGFAAPTGTKQTVINSSDLSLQGLTVRWNLDF